MCDVVHCGTKAPTIHRNLLPQSSLILPSRCKHQFFSTLIFISSIILRLMPKTQHLLSRSLETVLLHFIQRFVRMWNLVYHKGSVRTEEVKGIRRTAWQEGEKYVLMSGDYVREGQVELCNDWWLRDRRTNRTLYCLVTTWQKDEQNFVMTGDYVTEGRTELYNEWWLRDRRTNRTL
jgi:hypothetical protein